MAIYLEKPLAELVALKESPDLKAFDHMVISIVINAVQNGDQSRLEFLLNRTIGKVKDQLEVSLPKPFIIERGNGSQVVLGAKKEDEE